MSAGNGERRWRAAQTFEDLCELTALWIEDQVPFHPYCALEEESDALRPTLAEFNRRGLMTTFSQPGEPGRIGDQQRAVVEGRAKEEVAKALYALGLAADLLALVYEPRVAGGYQVPISTWACHPHTWAGAALGDELLEHFEDACSSAAFADLCSAWQVVMIDPVWGREQYLWERVSEVLRSDHDRRFSSVPYDDGSERGEFIY